MSDQEAVDNFKRTGKHLGKFNSVESANKFAEQLHQEQAQQYVGNQPSQSQSDIRKILPFLLGSNSGFQMGDFSGLSPEEQNNLMSTNLAQKNFAQQTVRDLMQGYNLENQIQNQTVVRQGNEFDNAIKSAKAQRAGEFAQAELEGLRAGTGLQKSQTRSIDTRTQLDEATLPIAIQSIAADLRTKNILNDFNQQKFTQAIATAGLEVQDLQNKVNSGALTNQQYKSLMPIVVKQALAGLNLTEAQVEEVVQILPAKIAGAGANARLTDAQVRQVEGQTKLNEIELSFAAKEKIAAIDRNIILTNLQKQELKEKIANADKESQKIDAEIAGIKSRTNYTDSQTQQNQENLKNVTTFEIDGKKYPGIPNEKAAEFGLRQAESEYKFNTQILKAQQMGDKNAEKREKEKLAKSKLSAQAELRLLSEVKEANGGLNSEQRLVHMRMYNENSQEPFVYVRLGEKYEKIKLPPVKHPNGGFTLIIGEQISKNARAMGISVENYLEQVYYPQFLRRPAPWQQER